MSASPERIAILGAGPAGCALAAVLARAGRRVALFDSAVRPPLVVGESLLPSVVPILRELEIEDEVRAYGLYKPGATIVFGERDRYGFSFDLAEGDLPTYAYNVPRDRFDATLLGAARAAGAEVIRRTARVARAGGGRLSLDDASLDDAHAALDGAPDLLVDATGRARLFSRILSLPEEHGARRDAALFAHYDRAELSTPGDIHVDRLARGWCWRIPLRGRVSVGVVVHPDHLAGGMADRTEQLDAFVREEPILRAYLAGATRITAAARYDNYQLVSSRLHGDGWALAGDAAGFVDPIFSTGLHLALRGAVDLGHALVSGGGRVALDAWERRWLTELSVWKQIIEHWYDGRLFALFRVGRRMGVTPPGAWIDAHVTRHMTRIFTGEAGTGTYSRELLKVLVPLGRFTSRPLRIR